MNATGKVEGIKDRMGASSYDHAILQWEVKGTEKNRSEQIKITAWTEKGRLLFSTNWSGTETYWSTINGNIKIDGCGNMLPVKQEQKMSGEEGFNAMYAFPNPSSTSFSIQIPNSFDAKVRIRVTDISGRLMEENTVKPGQLIQIGSGYQPGMYFAEMKSADRTKLIRLLKVRN
jgi:hypothetical protein